MDSNAITREGRENARHGMLTDMPLTHCGHAAVADTSGIIMA
jgi:hypothetical protein